MVSTYLTRLNILPDIHPHVAFITPQMEERKVREESGRAYLDFPLNETTIYPEYRNNPAELAKIKRSIDLIKNDTNVVISHIDIHGYASPEGPYSNNERLARERTRNPIYSIDFIKDALAASPMPSVAGMCCVMPMPIPGLVP